MSYRGISKARRPSTLRGTSIETLMRPGFSCLTAGAIPGGLTAEQYRKQQEEPIPIKTAKGKGKRLS
jgi:hypothetical protein